MALPILEKDISHISKLADQPNDVSGGELSAADLKAEFDRAGNDIKAFLNDTLIPYLQGVEAAASIGIRTISGLSDAKDIQAALEGLKLAIDNTSVGGIPDASLAGAKLIEKTITNREIGDGAVEADNIADKAVTGEKIADGGIGSPKIADESVLHQHLGKLVVENENIADNTIDAAGKIKDGTITAKKYASRSIPAQAIQVGAVGTNELAAEAVTPEKLSDETEALFAPAYTYGTTDLTAGTSALTTGTLHFVYE